MLKSKEYRFSKVMLIRVVDGDTYDFEIDLGFKVKTAQRFRLKGFDTPETYRPRNAAERLHGMKAKEFVINAFNSANDIVIQSFKSGIYSRWEASFFLDGISLVDLLAASGMAKKDSYLD